MTDLVELKERVEKTNYDLRLLTLAVIAVAEQLKRLADSQQK